MADEKDLIFPMHLDIDPKDFENKWKQTEPKLQAILDARPLKAKIDIDSTGLAAALEIIVELQKRADNINIKGLPKTVITNPSVPRSPSTPKNEVDELTKLSAYYKELEQDMSHVRMRQREIREELAKLEAQKMDATITKWEGVEKSIMDTNNQIEQYKQKISSLKASSGDKYQNVAAVQEINKYNTEIDKLKIKIKELNKEGKVEANTAGIDSNISKLKSELTDIDISLKKIADDQVKAFSENSVIETQKTKLNSLQKELSEINAEYQKLASKGSVHDSHGGLTPEASALIESHNKTKEAIDREQVSLSKLSAEDAKRKQSLAALSATQAKTMGDLDSALKKPEETITQINAKINQLQKTSEKLNFNPAAAANTGVEIDRLKNKLTSMQTPASALSLKIKNLSKEWDRLSATERRGDQGKRILREFKDLSTEANKATGSLRSVASAQERLNNTTNRGLSAVHTQNKLYQAQRGILNGLPQFVNSYVSILGAYRLGQNIVDTTAEFEMQRVALAAIIQNKAKADELFSQNVELGLKSPFQIKDLITYTKQLAAYKIETDDLFDTTKRLADVSAGLGVGMDRLVLAYGQVRAASVLRGQELRQFTEAGIPLVSLLADKFTKLNGEATSTGDVFKLISQRAVSFNMVKEVFDDMTNAGGTFYRMQEIQSQTLKGSLSNIKDAYQKMFMQIGNSEMGPMKDAVDAIKELMDNWEAISKIITAGAVSFGIVKVAMLANNAVLRRENAENITSIITSKKKEAILLRQAAVYRALKDTELEKIKTSTMMTAADWKQLIVEGRLKDESILRMVALKKMTPEMAKELIVTEAATKAKIGLTVADIENASTMKRSVVVRRMAIASIKAYTAALWASMKVVLMNPMTWAVVAIAAIVKLTSHIIKYNREYSDMSNNIRKDSALLANEMTEAYSRMKDVVQKGLAPGATEQSIISARKSLQDIIEKNQFIKDIIDERLKSVDSEAERLEVIRNMWNQIQVAAAGDNGDMAFSQKTTGSLMNDDVVENAEDLAKRLTAIDKYLSDMGARGYQTVGIRDAFKKLKEDFNLGTITLDEFQEKLQWIYKVPGAPKSAEFVGDLVNKLGFASAEARKLNEDFNKFKDDYISRIQEINGQKIDKYADKLGLSDANFNEFQTKLAVVTDAWIKSLGDIDIAAKQLLITNTKLSFQFPFKNEETPVEPSAFERNYNAYIAKMGYGDKFKVAPSEEGAPPKEGDIKKDLKDKREANKDRLAELDNLLKNTKNKDKAYLAELRKSRKDTATELTEIENLWSNFFGGQDKNRKQTDPRISALKAQLDLVNEAYQEYLKLSEYLGKDAAKTKVTAQYGGQNKPISGVTNTGLPLAFTQVELDSAYAAGISGFEKLGKDAVDEGRNAFKKQADNAFDEIKRNIQENLDKMAREIEQTQRANDFYEKMLDLTGSKNAAEKLTRSMGMVVGGIRKDMQNAVSGSLGAYGKDVNLSDVKSIQAAINKMREDGLENGAKAAQKNLDLMVDYEQKELEEILSGLEEFMTAEQQKVKIAEETQKEIARITGNPYLSPQRKEAGIAAVKKRGIAKSANVDYEALRSMDSYVQAFEDLDRVGDATLTKLKAELQALAAQTKDATGLKTITDQILKIEKVQESRNPFRGLVDGIAEYKAALTNLMYAQEMYAENSKEVAAAQTRLKAAQDKMSDGIKAIKSDFDEAAGAITGVIDLTKKIADQFGLTFSDETQEYIDAFTGGIEIASAAIGILTVAVTILDTVLWPLLLVAVAIGAAFLQWKILDSLINMSTTKKLAANVKMIETLEERLKQLARAEDDVIGDEYVKNIKNQIAATKELIEIEESNIETNKKGKHFLWWSWADKEAIAESKENISQYYDDIEQLQEEFMQEMTGYSGVVDAAYAFADAWYNAWLSMDDTTDAIMEKFDEMVDSMIIKSILAEVVAAKLKPLFDEVEAAYANDNKLDMSELASIQGKLNGLAEGLNADLNAIMGNWLRSGGDDKRAGGENLTGISAAVSSMSEDTANTMGGYLNSGLMQWVKQTGLQTQILAAIQSQDVKTPLANMYQLQQQSLDAINSIKADTAIMVSRLSTLVENQNSTMINGGQKAVNVRLLN